MSEPKLDLTEPVEQNIEGSLKKFLLLKHQKHLKNRTPEAPVEEPEAPVEEPEAPEAPVEPEEPVEAPARTSRNQ